MRKLIMWKRRKPPLRQPEEAEILLHVEEQSCRQFSDGEIQLAINSFEGGFIIGKGSFGQVFKGLIDNGATIVAIKEMGSMSVKGIHEFQMEVEMLSKLRHTNIVSLIGYCSHPRKMALVYEYVPNGSLADHLYPRVGDNHNHNHNHNNLSWVQLLRICKGAACGLDYLHTGARPNVRIIHHDVKSSNILLGQDWGPKISDSGLFKFNPLNDYDYQTQVTTQLIGTVGYLDPEYMVTGRQTWKSDVYNFGVILFEVLSGRPPMDRSLPEEQYFLPTWVKRCIKEGALDQIINPILAGQILLDSLKVFVHIASQCLHSRPKNRPTMEDVVISLTLALSLQERTSSFRLHKEIFNATTSFNDEDEQTFTSTEDLVDINSGIIQDRDGERLNTPLFLQSEQLCRQFSLPDIKSATNNFDKELIIGKGGFGNVYKGFINNETTEVAIKRLKPMSQQGAPEFWTEIDMLSKIQHINIITLIGYCQTQEEMILVYEYMVHGTLADHIHKISQNSNNYSLSWLQRLKICIGAAHGLNHLHTGTDAEHRVIHRDIKSSNILLNGNWAAKISDFGLSKIGPKNQHSTHVTTNFKGMSGYRDYDYFVTHHLTRKSDVFAFGVVLFEVLCGRPALDLKLNAEKRLLAAWAQQCVNEGRLDQIIDPTLTGQIFSVTLEVFKQIAVQCLHKLPTERPTMDEVVVSLEHALTLQTGSDFYMLEEDFFNTEGLDNSY